MSKLFFSRLAGFVFSCAVLHAAPSAPARTWLLVDDHRVLYRSGTKRVLHPAERRPEPVIAQDKPWELTIAYNTVHRDPRTGRYQLWYQTLGSRSPERAGVAYAESNDGIVWRKPLLGQFKFEGADSNLVLDLADGLDETGYRLPGFTKADAVPLTGDSLRHVVSWKNKTLRDLPAAPCMLRVHLDEAELFAVTLH